MLLEQPDDIEIALPDGPRDWRVAVNLYVAHISSLSQQEISKSDVVLFTRNHERGNTRFIGRIVENCSVVEEQFADGYASRRRARVAL